MCPQHPRNLQPRLASESAHGDCTHRQHYSNRCAQLTMLTSAFIKSNSNSLLLLATNSLTVARDRL